MATTDNKARYIMIGGFLGAGKTTAILQLARYLKARGKTVGLITNDQGTGLVDTAMARASEFPVEEIAGGCFCCRFNSLVDASQRLTASTRPDVLIAEPVGSCTDLMATVGLPMQQLYGGNFAIAPLSVMMDPMRAMRVLGLGEGRQFSPKVMYIYEKQLEEANLLVINKADLLDDAQAADLKEALRRKFPRAEVMIVSARHARGLEPWFEQVLTREMNTADIMEVDYVTYGAGEAMLGWLNAGVLLLASGEFDGNRMLRQVAQQLHDRLRARDVEVAHLKMTLSPSDDPLEVGVINLVRSEASPEISFELTEPLTEAELTVNLRAEASPEVLEWSVREVMDALSAAGEVQATVTDLQCFRPGQPDPTHRVDPQGVEHRPVLPDV
jgi:Ni2+-binding GTPase involved in maturation of urease and hydrogenase